MIQKLQALTFDLNGTTSPTYSKLPRPHKKYETEQTREVQMLRIDEKDSSVCLIFWTSSLCGSRINLVNLIRKKKCTSHSKMSYSAVIIFDLT